jgi:hypothetical protein
MYFNSPKGKFVISGDVNSLIPPELSLIDDQLKITYNVKEYGFYKLFYNMTSILDAK